jgi:hypothetical protein
MTTSVTRLSRSQETQWWGLLHGIYHDEDLIRVEFENHDVREGSDGLHGDLFMWLRNVSKYPYDIGDDLDFE